jgi:hypothetical protein
MCELTLRYFDIDLQLEKEEAQDQQGVSDRSTESRKIVTSWNEVEAWTMVETSDIPFLNSLGWD